MHTAVLLEETVCLLDIQEADTIFDGTLGFAGHAESLISKLGSQGSYIGVDRDLVALEYAKKKLAEYSTAELYHGN